MTTTLSFAPQRLPHQWTCPEHSQVSTNRYHWLRQRLQKSPVEMIVSKAMTSRISVMVAWILIRCTEVDLSDSSGSPGSIEFVVVSRLFTRDNHVIRSLTTDHACPTFPRFDTDQCQRLESVRPRDVPFDRELPRLRNQNLQRNPQRQSKSIEHSGRKQFTRLLATKEPGSLSRS